MDRCPWHCTGDREQEKEMQKGKMIIWRGLTNSWEKKGSKRQRRKQRYTHLNAEFQRIARRDKKAFLSDQCKEIEENNRLENTWDVLKKIKDTKGTFHAEVGTIKDRNGMDLREAEDIKKRWQEYIKGYCMYLLTSYTKKISMTWITMMVWSLT